MTSLALFRVSVVLMFSAMVVVLFGLPNVGLAIFGVGAGLTIYAAMRDDGR